MVEIMLLLIKRFMACLRVKILGFEECHEDLFIDRIYGVLNIDHFRDGQSDRKIYVLKMEGYLVYI
jgi:hypothetical protein